MKTIGDQRQRDEPDYKGRQGQLPSAIAGRPHAAQPPGTTLLDQPPQWIRRAGLTPGGPTREQHRHRQKGQLRTDIEYIPRDSAPA